MRRVLGAVLALTILSSVNASSQTRRRATQKKPPATSFEEKQQAELRAGREQVAAQIKTLTQFLYLFGGIAKSIETAEQLNRGNEQSSVGMSPQRIEENKSKLKDSIRSLSVALDKLESSFRLNPVLQKYYSSLMGVAKLAQAAEAQASASNFDQAGRSLVAAVDKLTNALVALH